VLGHWVNDSEFAGSVRLNPKSQGSDDWDARSGGKHLCCSQTNGGAPIKITGFSSFVGDTSRCVLLFCQAFTAIKFVANLDSVPLQESAWC